MPGTNQPSQTDDQLLGRRHEYRFLANVRDALVTNAEGANRAVKARRVAFSRRGLETFSGVLVGDPTARFRVWLHPLDERLIPDDALEFTPQERWHVLGVVERVIEGEPVSHDVMARRYGD